MWEPALGWVDTSKICGQRQLKVTWIDGFEIMRQATWALNGLLVSQHEKLPLYGGRKTCWLTKSLISELSIQVTFTCLSDSTQLQPKFDLHCLLGCSKIESGGLAQIFVSIDSSYLLQQINSTVKCHFKKNIWTIMINDITRYKPPSVIRPFIFNLLDDKIFLGKKL